MARESVTVFFPCFNDEHTIGDLVRTADKILAARNYPYEILVINDGSTDNSNLILRSTKKTVKKLRVISHRSNKGYGATLADGFRQARNDLVFYTDGDGQYDVKELALLFPLMTDDIDVVNGIKTLRQDPLYRIITGNIYKFFVRNAFGIDIFDTDCDFRLIRRRILKDVTLRCTSGSICVELVKKLQLAGARFREVSVHHYDRKYGSSQFFRPMRILNTLVELVSLWISFYVTSDS